jgi:hypothetical protein
MSGLVVEAVTLAMVTSRPRRGRAAYRRARPGRYLGVSDIVNPMTLFGVGLILGGVALLVGAAVGLGGREERRRDARRQDWPALDRAEPRRFDRVRALRAPTIRRSALLAKTVRLAQLSGNAGTATGPAVAPAAGPGYDPEATERLPGARTAAAPERLPSRGHAVVPPL